MTNQFLEHMERHIATSRPKVLELRELKKQRERVRREEIARVLEKYKELAKEWQEEEIYLYSNSKNVKRRNTIILTSLVTTLVTIIILSICISPVFLAFLFFLIVIVAANGILLYSHLTKPTDFVKIISKNDELCIAGNQERIQNLSAIDIEAAIENWLLEQEEKEIENAEPDDIETIYK